MDKSTEIAKVKEDLLVFNESPLFAYRTENKYFSVVGEGSLDSHIMFVGEAPGKNEALTGKPFCGAAGKFLSVLLESIGLKREDVYITNIVNDRPPDNRDPTPEEIEMYSQFLVRQINIIRPKVIATLGRHSMGFIMNHFGLGDELAPISKLHGKLFKAETSYGPISIVTLYHPAAALYNGGMRDTLKKDFGVLKKYV